MDTPAQAPHEALQSRLVEIIGTEIIEPESPLTPDTNLFEEGLDSMAIMQLLVLIEEEFSTAIPMAEVIHEHFVNARAIAALVHSKR